MNRLSLATLLEANRARLPEFRTAGGEIAHAKPDGSDWSPNDWAVAVMGELGEAANVLKKVRRGDLSLDEARPVLAKELADVQTYLSILADQVGVDLGAATISKFNEVSERVGSTVRLAEDYFYRLASPEEQAAAAQALARLDAGPAAQGGAVWPEGLER